MAGYSSTPLAKKLGIKPHSRLALIHAPAGFQAHLQLPEGVLVSETLAQETFDVLLFFVTSVAQLTEEFAEVQDRLATAGGLWVAWPKKASGVVTDLNDAIVRETGLRSGLVDNKVCAIDEVWSGLRFVIRLQDRPGRQ